MPTRIDRMTIEASGLSEEQSRRLALLVAAALGEAGAVLGPRSRPALHVEVSASGGTVEQLARLIVGRALRELRQDGY